MFIFLIKDQENYERIYTLLTVGNQLVLKTNIT